MKDGEALTTSGACKAGKEGAAQPHCGLYFDNLTWHPQLLSFIRGHIGRVRRAHTIGDRVVQVTPRAPACVHPRGLVLLCVVALCGGSAGGQWWWAAAVAAVMPAVMAAAVAAVVAVAVSGR